MEIRRITEAMAVGMWVITDEDNPAALTAYRRAGGTAEEKQVVFVWTFDEPSVT